MIFIDGIKFCIKFFFFRELMNFGNVFNGFWGKNFEFVGFYVMGNGFKGRNCDFG